ncbi:E3 ubiquitin ligase TRAF3IP2 [Betta splendens]|uniref:E3 ubiquitin ligase TRAF3IP2 n=1 Tax=Betta splendens TaxID=158456 RepID=A0A6P7MDH7_BETSP|nr:E3 ubiquitin ligase TRAF3IP2 [Betta splendens]XP_055364081.1 E3 ubiquitin ligase TRAF3IP2 [Betta splendens]
MLPTSVYSAPNSHFSRLSQYLSSCRNTPEEDDETMSKEQQDDRREPDRPSEHGHLGPPAGDARLSPQMPQRQRGHGRRREPGLSSASYRPQHSLLAACAPPTPFPSQAEGPWLHPSFASSWSGYPSSLPSYLSEKECSRCFEESGASGDKFWSLPGRRSDSSSSGGGGLEQPLSLRSNPPSANLCRHTLSPYSCPPPGAPCWAQCPADTFSRGHVADGRPWAQQRPSFNPNCGCALPEAGYTQTGYNVPVKEKQPPYSTPLSLEQRKVFVTYEADSDKHVNEIIKFVALLRHNGFDTHIDIFEQQFRSISKIDFMERYLSEKEYLIIIIISPKYYETVTASPVGFENDERTFNTVYIHKQLQNEFIQNGSKNFRFIPILFPGAKRSHVPTWLQNTHVFTWPRDRDDILRRLMRVEKYNPPPIGELPTIVSIPI